MGWRGRTSGRQLPSTYAVSNNVASCNVATEIYCYIIQLFGINYKNRPIHNAQYITMIVTVSE
jgi:hypothetical protein